MFNEDKHLPLITRLTLPMTWKRGHEKDRKKGTKRDKIEVENLALFDGGESPVILFIKTKSANMLVPIVT